MTKRLYRQAMGIRSETVPFHGWGGHIARAMEALRIRTWGDLAALAELEFLSIKGVGRRQTDFVRQKLVEVGLDFEGHVPTPADRRQSIERCPDTCGVYFIRCRQFVKIGHGVRLRRRVAGIAAWCPFEVEVLATIPALDRIAAERLERELHRRFRPLRHRLEWFKLEEPLIAYIESVTAGGRR